MERRKLMAMLGAGPFALASCGGERSPLPPTTAWVWPGWPRAYARVNGVLVVAAAGNDSTDIDTAPVWPASPIRI